MFRGFLILSLFACFAFVVGCGSNDAQKGTSYSTFPIEKAPGVQYSEPNSQVPEGTPSVEGPTSAPPGEEDGSL